MSAKGYAGGNYSDPGYYDVLEYSQLSYPGTSLINHTEVVRVTYNPEIISTESLIKKFWEGHDPTQLNRQGNDVGEHYRSALYWTSPEQQQIARSTKDRYQSLLTTHGYGKIVTEIKALEQFWPAEADHQDYLKKNPNGYCPNHATGITFEKVSNAKTENTISPLGGMEIIVVEAEEEGSCPYCTQFAQEVTAHYQGTVPLRSVPASALSGFELKSPTWATPTILFIKDGKEVWSKQGALSAKAFYQALEAFKLGKTSEPSALYNFYPRTAI